MKGLRGGYFLTLSFLYHKGNGVPRIGIPKVFGTFMVYSQLPKVGSILDSTLKSPGFDGSPSDA